MGDDDAWEKVWNTRADAIASVLGPAHDNVLHSPTPLFLGGAADVLVFHQRVPGITYVTADLSGEPGDCFASYELMICHRSIEETWGGNIISQLAAYAIDQPIESGETMDIDSATPPNCAIKAFIFDNYGTFSMFGQEFDLRLCLGITKEELQYAHERGSQHLLALLKQHNVYPYTDLNRKTIPGILE